MESRRKSSSFLPDYYKSPDNKKFLNATLDQLISEPKLKKLNGYIGRAFSASYSYNNNYVIEDTPERNYYQLEPGVIIKNGDHIEQVITYTDVINKIKFYGGNPESVSTLFSGETYNYDGHFDFDKITNFGNYFWLPNGPESVNVGLKAIELENEFSVNYSKVYDSYVIDDENYANPTIYVVRGGSYTFTSQNEIWIQTNQDQSGKLTGYSNISSRIVYGVEENGGKSVSFNVPNGNEQDYIKNMTTVADVDFVIDSPLSEISNKFLVDIDPLAFDGIVSDLDYKYVIFTNQHENSAGWVSDVVRDRDGNVAAGYETSGFTATNDQKLSIWQIRTVAIDDEIVITVAPKQKIEPNTKTFVKSGMTYAGLHFYNDGDSQTLMLVDQITSDLDALYFLIPSQSEKFGVIRIIDPFYFSLDVGNDIIGKTEYTTPNRVRLTNGMKIKFDDLVSDNFYRDNVFYVEGVGTAINLVPVENLQPVELWNNSAIVSRGAGYSVGDILEASGGEKEFDSATLIRVNSVDNVGGIVEFSIIQSAVYSVLPENPAGMIGGSGSGAVLNLYIQPDNAEYVTIKRGSIDLNRWSRTNRWFHEEVVRKTAEYNNKEPLFDQQLRAKRPIIEFDPNIQLYNSGKFFSEYVDIANSSYTDALSDFHGATDLYSMNSTVVTGTKIVFMGDSDQDVRTKLFVVTVEQIDNSPKIFLTESKTFGEGDIIIVLSGENEHKSYYLKNGVWKESQCSTNDSDPLFDVLDSNNISFGDGSVYPSTTFSGNKIFSYKPGSTYDDILNKRISYRNIDNVGDIEFLNSFETEDFSYSSGVSYVTERISTGYLNKYSGESDMLVNVWKTLSSKPEQSQQYSSVLSSGQSEFIIPGKLKNDGIVMLLNSVIVPRSSYIVEGFGDSTRITFVNVITKSGDRLDVFFNPIVPNPNVFYDIPVSIQNNPLNATLFDFTMGQMRAHVKKILSQSPNLTGIDFGSNNARDFYYKDKVGEILQHSSPALYSFLFLASEKLKFVESVQNASREYLRFKNRFLETAKKYDMSSFSSVAEAVDFILENITKGKSIDSPWFYSDMVPYGNNKKETKYTVLNVDIRKYKIFEIFDQNALSNTAVLVYLNGIQLLKDRDYVFSETTPSVEILESIVLKLNDVIQIVSYNTDGNFIPETPTKLGLYPAYEPVIETDDTYSNDVTVIVGHDGSVTPAFNDHRDHYLLELEKRIFNNIKTSFDYGKNSVFINTIGGKFRNLTNDEVSFESIISGSFLKWVGQNQLNFSENITFSGNNPRTWNHRNSQITIDNSIVNGNWRSIYKKYFDTYKPHTKPWEMLGFSIKPTWWESFYGPAPYTGGNKILWDDLENGIIRDGNRKGVDSRYVRRGLSQIIPVDEFGNLKMPNDFMVKSSNYTTMSSSWAVGDCGPVETAWRNSSDYPFAVQIALALSRPGEYFSLLIDTSRYTKNETTNQVSLVGSNDRLTPRNVVINGLSSGGTITRAAGWTNWVVDNLVAQGISGARYVADAIKNVNVQLCYRVAGFTDKSLTDVYADQTSPTSFNESVLVPKENYNIVLHKSSPNQRVVYSAVIIRKTTTGYAVEGYDYKNPYFSIIPSRSNNNHYVIKSGTKTAKIYNDYQKAVLVVPYGYEFRTRQQIVDFLVSYQRYLLSTGLIFDDFDENLRQRKDWILSAREFLTWSNQGWKENSMIVLSPVSDKIRIETGSYTADEITGKWNESKILDLNFNVIPPEMYSVFRDDGVVEIETVSQQSVSLIDISLVQYEHVLVMDNETVFSDIIYQPTVGSRQLRLKLVGKKTDDWYGNINPPGFMYYDGNVQEWSSKSDYFKGDLVKWKEKIYSALEFIPSSTEFNFEKWKLNSNFSVEKMLLRNFSTNASKFIDIYDVDGEFYEKDLEKFGASLIGFRTRSYLDDFGVDTQTQLKFYQGFIKDKGTLSAIESLTKTKFNKLGGDIDFDEEWAIRVGELGFLNNKDTVEIIVKDDARDTNPIVISVVDSEEQSETFGRNIIVSDLHSSTTNSSLIFGTTPRAFTDKNAMTGGFVADIDVNLSVLSLQDSFGFISSNLSDIGDGYTIAVGKSKINSWDVFRVTKSELKLLSVEYGLDNTAIFSVDTFHDLTTGEYIIVKGFGVEVDGLYQVLESVGLKSFSVLVTEEISKYLEDVESVDGNGTIFNFKSVKYRSCDEYDETIQWKYGDKFWIGSDTENWDVFQKNIPYTLDYFATESSYGVASKIIHTDNIIFISYKDYGDGVVIAINREDNAREVIQCPLTGCNGFGSEMYVKNSYLYVSIEDSVAYGGAVVVFDIEDNFKIIQYIMSSGVEGFGKSLAYTTNTGQVLVSSPTEKVVHVYKYFDTERKDTEIETTDGIFTYLLSIFPESTESVRVTRDDGALLVPVYDYFIANQEITFTADPGSRTYRIEEYRYYLKTSTISLIGSYDNTSFGHIIACPDNKSQVFIGAPLSSVSGIDSGSVYLFDQIVESFVYDGSVILTNRQIDTTSSGQVTNTLISNGRVLLQYEDYDVISGNIVLYADAVEVGDTINVFMNEWSLTQHLVPPVSMAGMKYGNSIATCETGCNLIVSSPQYKMKNYQYGAVFKYDNSPRSTGRLISTVVSPVISPSDSIILNGFEVFADGTSMNDLSESINLANIPGISSTVEGGKLQIVSNSVIENDLLMVSNGVGNLLSDLGVNVFQLAQTIQKPYDHGLEYFGAIVSISKDGNKLFVSSRSPYVKIGQDWDNSLTNWDNSSTEWNELIEYSGTIYGYETIRKSGSTSRRFHLVQEIIPQGIKDRNNYARNIYYDGGSLSVVSDNTDSEFYIFSDHGDDGFSLIRSTTDIVDSSSIYSISLYDRKNNSIVSFLDTVNPINTKVLGVADQNIDYKSELDPAWYSNENSEDTYAWFENKVGSVWWDLSVVRFKDYNQSDLKYRVSTHNQTINGSRIDVYEWVESDYPPSQYSHNIGDGIPFGENDGNFSVREYYDVNTGKTNRKYYYWVKDKISPIYGKNISVRYLANIITDPKSQNIPYAVAYGPNSLGLYNCNQFLDDDNIILRIVTKKEETDKTLHHEWHLFKENGNVRLPDDVINKIVDSLVGYDRMLRQVPDASLIGESRLGIGMRPRQTMFSNRKFALKTFIESINSKLKTVQVARLISMGALMKMQPTPDNTEYDLEFDSMHQALMNDFSFIENGTRVLINSDSTFNGNWSIYTVEDSNLIFHEKQEFNLTNYWEYDTWIHDKNFSTIQINRTIGTMSELEIDSIKNGDVIKIEDDGYGNYGIYEKQNGILVPLEIQNATIKISDAFYTTGDGENYPYAELRMLLEALYKEILIDQLSHIFVETVFLLFKYVFIEQKEPDWIMKTSFASVFHRIRKLDPYPIYVRDNQDYYLSFINEVKPYKTKIRQYLLGYNGEETLPVDCTDFDNPVFFDESEDRYRVLDSKSDRDVEILKSKKPWKDWYENSTLSIKSVEILASDFYSYAPTIIVRNGDGTAKLRSILGEDGKISEIIVVNGGGGFTEEPDIYVSGGSGVTLLRAELYHRKVRTISSTIKFDRTDYYGEFQPWKPTTIYKPSQYFSFDEKVYIVKTEFISGVEFEDSENIEVIGVESYPSAMHRAKKFYNSTDGSKNRNIRELFTGLDYSGVRVKGTLFSDEDIPFYEFERYGSPTENIGKIDSYIKNIRFINTNQGISSSDITVDGGKFYDKFSGYGPEELVAGAVYDTVDIRVFTRIKTGPNQGKHYGYRIFHDMNQYMDYHNRDAEPTVQLARDFSEGDDVIYIKLHDEFALMGTYEINGDIVPQELMINGEKISYTEYDRGNNTISGISRNIDGRLQSISGLVHSKDSFVTVLNNLKRSRKYYRLSEDNTGILTRSLTINDGAIYVDDVTKFEIPSATKNRPGVIYINGEKIKYYRINAQLNTLEQITRGIDGTSIKLVHEQNSLVTDMSSRQEIIGGDDTLWVDFTKNTNNGTIGLFELSERYQAIFAKGRVSYSPD